MYGPGYLHGPGYGPYGPHHHHHHHHHHGPPPPGYGYGPRYGY